jgi:hypothetical protein
VVILNSDKCLLQGWVTQIRHFIHVSRIGYVSDTGVGAIRVRYAPDTPAGVSEYPDNSDTPPICSDTSMIFFSRYFGGFGQEYAPDTPPIRF